MYKIKKSIPGQKPSINPRAETKHQSLKRLAAGAPLLHEEPLPPLPLPDPLPSHPLDWSPKLYFRTTYYKITIY